MACYNCIIRNPKSTLVLQTKGSKVLIVNFNGFDPQRWQITPVGAGKNLIVNKANGEALDIEGNKAESRARVITSAIRGRIGDEKQQWFINSDGTLANVAGLDSNLVLDIDRNDFTPGNFVIVFPKSGQPNQKFNLECQ